MKYFTIVRLVLFTTGSGLLLGVSPVHFLLVSLIISPALGFSGGFLSPFNIRIPAQLPWVRGSSLSHFDLALVGFNVMNKHDTSNRITASLLFVFNTT